MDIVYFRYIAEIVNPMPNSTIDYVRRHGIRSDDNNEEMIPFTFFEPFSFTLDGARFEEEQDINIEVTQDDLFEILYQLDKRRIVPLHQS